MENSAREINAEQAVIVGRDQSLLDSRKLLLRHLGYEVHPCLGLNTLLQTTSQRHVFLVILCHTLTVVEQERAASISLSAWPDADLLVLRRDHDSAWPPSFPSLDVSEGPLSLVNRVGRIADVWKDKGLIR